MITISTTKGSACKVQSSTATFFVFSDEPQQGVWSLLSHPEEILSSPSVISWPGEYDFLGVTMRGIGQDQGKQVSYQCVADGVRLGFIDAPVLDWTDSDIERLGDVDVLVIAADQPKKVTAIIESIDPRIVVLFDVKDGDTSGVAKALGQPSVSPINELKVKPGSLPQDSRQVVLLG